MVQTHDHPCRSGGESHTSACQEAKDGVISSCSIICLPPVSSLEPATGLSSHTGTIQNLCAPPSLTAVILPLLVTMADTEGLLAGSSRGASLTQGRSKCGCGATLVVQKF